MNKERKYPTYQLRCNTTLYDKLREAGPEAVRLVLQRAFCTTKEQELVIQSGDIVLQKEAEGPEVVLQKTEAAPVVIQDPPPVVLQTTGAKPVPKWAAQVDKLAEAKRARDRERAAKEQAGRTV